MNISENVLTLDLSQYCERIRAQHGRRVSDPKYSPLPVLMGSHRHSYLDELSQCAVSFSRCEYFNQMPKQERQCVAGTLSPPDDRWFGSMVAAGRYKNLVNESPEIIGEFIDQIPLKGSLEPQDAVRYINGMLSIRGVAMSTATRLLAMKRPDSCVPLTRANRNGIKRILDKGYRLPSVSSSNPQKSAEQYVSLLLDIWKAPWCNSERPTGEVEGLIWDGRVALLDVITYDPE